MQFLSFAVLAACVLGHSIDTSLATRNTLLAKRALCERDIKCILNSEIMEGPFYVANPLVRSDIREDRQGAPFTLTIQVIDVTTCEPASNLWVDIWHADGRGEYSGWASEDNLLSIPAFPYPLDSEDSHNADKAGESGDWSIETIADSYRASGLEKRGTPVESSRFLRGVQRTDEAGKVTFDSIVPGWYEGRCDHVHVRVHSSNATVQDGHLMGGTVSHTGQLFFEDAVVEALRDPETGVAPYNTRTDKPRKNMEDGLYRDEDGILQVIAMRQRTSEVQDGFIGDVIMGVDPSVVQPPSKGPDGPPGGHWPGHGKPPGRGGHGALIAFVVIVVLVGASAGGYYIYREKYATGQIQLQ